ncbi:M56 family metallopeptidase [Colwellia sp. 4_MG-2023]|jgi:TonB family protein|uniref:M56 family metallopeptidase n=1 Tax=unclassified Colwellia TaxID=196834 RepID=UPI0026E3F568|nr:MULTISPECIES: M56 family metallopeptidase [unclassified Colwellia]MDO6488492.1 M56 family metallopeptidase [Colwellia sp. 6_MG-2023]MDO6507421.1 M56 family metallopeptidase [Colwellia sp. 5_MG-2023]MDO6556159.1 M56 family metallopeptidase [Colwellia sp. 4_MG-2023]
MLDNVFTSPLLTSLALTLLHFLWQGLLVAIVLKSALLIFNNSKPQLRYALSAFAMLINLLLPLITFIVIYQTEVSSTHFFVNSFALNEFIQELEQPDSLFNYKELIETLNILLPYLSILWLATVTLLASKLLIEISTVNKLPLQGTVEPSDKLQKRFDELAKQISLRILPRLLISLKVDVPMAIGWLKPVVLIPASMISGLNNAQLEMLILHELAHIRRHDYLVNFLQTLVEILLFFHPAVSWVSKQMRNEREYCSDDIAVQHCGDAIAYAHTLADTASLCTKIHNNTIPNMAMAASGGDLKQRVIRLVDHHCAPNNNISKWFASATIIFSIVLLSSKQLLTMPLLDLWPDETPWKQTTKSEENQNTLNNNVTLLSPIFSENLPSITTPSPNKPADNTFKTVLGKKELSTNNILTTLVSVDRPIEKKSDMDIIKRNSLALNNLQPNSNEPIQLKNSSQNTATEPEQLSKNNVNNDSLMVTKAFERTTSNSAYQQELIQLRDDSHLSNTFISNHASKKSQHNSVLNNEFTTNADKNETSKESSLLNHAISKTAVTSASAHIEPEDKVITIAPIRRNAKKLKSVNPIYPNIAKRKGIELEVEVNFTIDINGKVKNLQFINQQKVSYFKNSIRSAIRQWRFLPAKVNGKPVESQMSKVFAFSLHS